MAMSEVWDKFGAYNPGDGEDETVERLAQATARELPSWVPSECVYARALGRLAAVNGTSIDANPFHDGGPHYLAASWHRGWLRGRDLRECFERGEDYAGYPELD